MGLAAFQRMRRNRAKQEAAKKRKPVKPVEKMNKTELIAWLLKNKGITIADPKKKTMVQLLEMTTMTFGDMVNDPAVNKEASKEPVKKAKKDDADASTITDPDAETEKGEDTEKPEA